MAGGAGDMVSKLYMCVCTGVCVCVCVCVYLYMCRLSGPSRLDEDGPDGDKGSEVTVPRLKGFEWSKTETAMDARVLAPEHDQSIGIFQ